MYCCFTDTKKQKQKKNEQMYCCFTVTKTKTKKTRANVLLFYRYELLLEAVDGIVRESYSIRQTMGLPERENDDLPDDFSKYCSILLFDFFRQFFVCQIYMSWVG